jgi:hypothetical protein
VRYARSPRAAFCSGGFTLLLSVTLLAAFLYLARAPATARHDGLYGAALTTVWGLYFFHDKLLRHRVLGPLLTSVGELLPASAALTFLPFVLWLVWSHS